MRIISGVVPGVSLLARLQELSKKPAEVAKLLTLKQGLKLADRNNW